MLPIPYDRDFSSRRASVATTGTNWSQWTEDRGEETPISPGADLAHLVRRNQLALSALEKTSPEEPTRYQDERGSIYYEYDNDWVSLVSPTSNRFSRLSRLSHFGGGNSRRQTWRASTLTTDEDQASPMPPTHLHPNQAMNRKSTSVPHPSLNGARPRSGMFKQHRASRASWRRSQAPALRDVVEQDSQSQLGLPEEVDTDYEGALEALSNNSILGHDQGLDHPANPFTLRLQPASGTTSQTMSMHDGFSSDGSSSTLNHSSVYSDSVGNKMMSNEDMTNIPLSPTAYRRRVSFADEQPLPQQPKPVVPAPVPEEPIYRDSSLYNGNESSSTDSFPEKDLKAAIPPYEPPVAALRNSNRNSRMSWMGQDLANNGSARNSAFQPGVPAHGPHGPEAVAPVSGWALITITFALALAVFVAGVDINIISTAIPNITADFGSVDDIGWYGSSFLMTTCAFQILWGRLYTALPVKWTFISSLAIFEIGSLICAVSPNSNVFIFGRAVQGVGVSGMLSGALIIMGLVVPLPKRSLLGGIIGAMEGLAMISAPLIGGALTQGASWRWCFYINLPIGGVVLAVIAFILRIPQQPRSAEVKAMTFFQRFKHVLDQLDLISTAILIPGIVCVLLALQWGGTKYDWDDIGIILLFVLTGVFLAIFLYLQHMKQDRAMIPPRIFKQRTVFSAFWFMVCISSSLVVMSYFLPLWFQSIRQYSPSKSGVHMLPMLIAVIVAVLGSGALVSGLGYYTPFMILGTIFMSVGAGLLSTLKPDTSDALLIVYPAIFGIGVGFSFQQPVIAAQTVLSNEDIPIGTTVVVFGQSFGAAIVLSIANSVFANRLASNVKSLIGPIQGIDTETLLNSATSGHGGDSTDKLLTAVVKAGGSQEELLKGFNKSIVQSFYVAVAFASLSILGAVFVEWRSVKAPQDVAQNETRAMEEVRPEEMMDNRI